MQVGRNLILESEQDTANFKQKQTSANGNFALTGNILSSSISGSQGKINSTYQSVQEQTAIQAGDGGFDINVTGNTHLKGAVIDSTLAAQATGNNYLTTGTLTTEDIQNKGEYKANNATAGFNFNTNLNPNSQDKQQPAGSTAGTLPKEGLSGIAVATSGEARGTTKSAIAAGSVTITDNEGQQALTGKNAEETVATLNRDTQHANGSIDNPFNQQKVQEQLEFLQLAGELVIQPVAAQAAKWIGDTFKSDPANPDAIDPAKVAAHAALGAAISQLLGTGWQSGAAAGALGDVLPQVLQQAFEKDANGKIKDEAKFKAASALIGAALSSAAGKSQDVNHAHMHAMCSEGMSKESCAQNYSDYISEQWSLNSLLGLARVIHAYEDSIAKGHQFKEYEGFGMLILKHGVSHLLGDALITPIEQGNISNNVKLLIDGYKKQCSTCFE